MILIKLFTKIKSDAICAASKSIAVPRNELLAPRKDKIEEYLIV